MADISTEFYWDNIVFKVENTLFRVPRCEFEQSSEVFADMFLLPSGAVERKEGQDKEHPIVLEGYKKDEFSCLLKVMFPRTKSLISGTNLELSLKKEEWVSVLKLSTIWNMSHIREYAIHRLSTDKAQALSHIEKIQLAREHRVAKWMEEGLFSLINGDYKLTRADLATVGWETSALILWIRENLIPSLKNSPFRFARDMIQCGSCRSSNLTNLHSGCFSCVQNYSDLIVDVASLLREASDLVVKLEDIRCSACNRPFLRNFSILCRSCSQSISNVRISMKKGIDEKINEIFGDEISYY